jgi:large subunit ribosomal protein L10
LNRDQKAAVIDEVAGQITASEAVYAVDYRGISVPQAAELRTRLRDDRAGAEALKELLQGPTAMTFVRGDAAAAAKALRDFRRSTGNQLLEFKGGWMNGAPLSADEIDQIAQLPSREVLIARLVGGIAAPLSGLAGAMNNMIAGLARALQGVADQKAGGPAETPTEE